MTGATSPFPRISPLGDHALTIAFADRLDPAAAALVAALAGRFASVETPGIVELVPGYVALSIRFEPRRLSYQALRDQIDDLLATPLEPNDTPPGRLVEIPVRYDGPDLAEVAAAASLTTERVIAIHSGREYRVALLGFVPGFAYLGALDQALILPRRSAPRPKVPAGSVAIAGAQTGVYPATTPGGWHLIGRTTTRMFDPTRSPPSLLAVGDRVRFVAER